MPIPTPPQDVLEFGQSDAYAKFLAEEERRALEAQRLEAEAEQRRVEERERERLRQERIEAERVAAEDALRTKRYRHVRYGENFAWWLGAALVVACIAAPFVVGAIWRPATIPVVGEEPIRSVYAEKYSGYTITIPWEASFERDLKAWEAGVVQAETARSQRQFRTSFLKTMVLVMGLAIPAAVLMCMGLQSLRKKFLEASWATIHEADDAASLERGEKRDRFFDMERHKSAAESWFSAGCLAWLVLAVIVTVQYEPFRWHHGIMLAIAMWVGWTLLLLVGAMAWDSARRLYWACTQGEIVTWKERVIVFDPLKTT